MSLDKVADHTKKCSAVENHEDLIRHAAPMLSNLNPKVAQKYIAIAAYKYLTERFDIEIDKNHMAVWAEDILEDYPDLRTVEIKRIIKRMTKGAVYNRIDVNTLNLAVQEYYQERSEAIARERERIHHNRKHIDQSAVKGQNVVTETGKDLVEAPNWFRDRTQELLKTFPKKIDRPEHRQHKARKQEEDIEGVVERREIGKQLAREQADMIRRRSNQDF